MLGNGCRASVGFRVHNSFHCKVRGLHEFSAQDSESPMPDKPEYAYTIRDLRTLLLRNLRTPLRLKAVFDKASCMSNIAQSLEGLLSLPR